MWLLFTAKWRGGRHSALTIVKAYTALQQRTQKPSARKIVQFYRVLDGVGKKYQGTHVRDTCILK